MSDTDTIPADPAEETAQDADTEPQEGAETDGGTEDWRKDFDPDKAAERIRKIQSENKNLRERAKTAEKKAEGADEKDQRITSLEAELLRERVGRRLNLPDELVDRLRGNNEEEILADAEKLVAIVSKPTPGGGKPSERLRGGGEPDQEPEPDLRKLVDEIPRR
jgi:hypothetical protein